MLLKHLDGILNYCRTKVRFGVVEAINGNIRMLINRGRGYKNLRYLLLKAQAHGRDQHRIRRFSENQESRVECHLLRILAQSPKFRPTLSVIATAMAWALELVFAGFPVLNAAEMRANRRDHENALAISHHPDSVLALELSIDAVSEIRRVADL